MRVAGIVTGGKDRSGGSMFRTEKPWGRVYSGHVSPETEVYEGSLTDFFRSSVEEHRDKIALTFYGATFDFACLEALSEKMAACLGRRGGTNGRRGRGHARADPAYPSARPTSASADLEALSEKMAASLAVRGVKKGDRVALMLPNCPQYVVNFFATVRLGAVVTQLNPMYVEREIEHILEDSGAETIFVYSDAYPRVKNVMGQTALENVIVVDFEGEPEDLESGHEGFGEVIGEDAELAPPVAIDPLEDLAVLQYTGGTTGVSKGAMLTHRNLVANVQQTLDVFVDDPAAFSNNQKIVAILPFFHIFGFTCVMLFGIRQGLNQLLLPRFDAGEVMDLVKGEEPVMFSGVPTMYMAINSSGADLREYGFDKVRTYNSGGAPLPVNLKRTFEEKTGRPPPEGYGPRDVAAGTHINPPFAGQGREGSIGVPIPS